MSLKNDNEFDNLFKRAAESYPLNTNNANWQDVLNKLEEDDSSKGFLWFRKWLVIGLLGIFLIGIGVVITSLYYKNKSHNYIAQKVNKSIIDTSDKNILNDIGTAVYSRVMDSLQKHKMLDAAIVDKKTIQYKGIVATTKPKIKIADKNSYANALDEVNENISTSGIQNTVKEALPPKDETKVDDISKSVFSEKNINVLEKNRKNLIGEDVTLSHYFDDTALINKAIDDEIKSNKLMATNSLVKSRLKMKPFVYAGLMYANDKSSLELKQNKGQGYSLAFLLGYQVSKHWSFETGFHIEKKEYYTTGENFNKSILPAVGDVKWIEAENKLLEIPILVRYSLPIKSTHQFSATFGISNYLVNNEYYEYEEEVGGVLKDGFVFYEKNTSNLLATYNFSIGYEFKVKKLGAFKIEPYINLPLKGTGLGREPLISRGIYFGWIYSFKH